MQKGRTLQDSKAMAETLARLAEAIAQRHGDCNDVALVGIQRRGVDIANRLAGLLGLRLGHPIVCGVLDITLYRDDWTTLSAKPSVRTTHIPFSIDRKKLVLVDDVLFTGRTIRAALEALVDFGRPAKVELLVLVDRGFRELPIHADYAGLTVETARDDRVDVLMTERDGKDEICLVSAG